MRKGENLRASCNACQRCRHGLTVLLPRRIGIGEDYHVCTGEIGGIFLAPFARTSGTARRGNSDARERVCSLFSFNHKHNLLGGHGLNDLGQAVEDATRIAQGVDPSLVAMGAPLPKALRL
jgi:hypothetical protein